MQIFLEIEHLGLALYPCMKRKVDENKMDTHMHTCIKKLFICKKKNEHLFSRKTGKCYPLVGSINYVGFD